MIWIQSVAGGYFFGCVPDGKAIMSTLETSFPSFKGVLLQILAEWKGNPRPFGSAYSMAIGDTVTQGTPAESECPCHKLLVLQLHWGHASLVAVLPDLGSCAIPCSKSIMRMHTVMHFADRQ